MEITKECQFKGKMRKIGAGADGMVYENCSNGKCHIVKETPKLYGDQEIIMIQKLMGLKKQGMKSTHIHLGYVSISECQKCYSKFAIKKKITPGKIHPGQFTKNGCYLIRQDKFDGDVISLLLKYAHDEEKYAEIVTALFVQMYIGTSELRKYGVRHNDLHAGNIFYKKVPRKTWKSGKVSVDSEYQFYIADFSRGKVCGREKTMNISQAAFFKRELKQLEKSIRAFHGEIIPPNSLLDSAAKAISQK